jgi:hypothetical protein
MGFIYHARSIDHWKRTTKAILIYELRIYYKQEKKDREEGSRRRRRRRVALRVHEIEVTCVLTLFIRLFNKTLTEEEKTHTSV